MHSKIRFVWLALLGLAFLFTRSGQAQFTWDGGADPDGRWSVGLNWSGDSAPAAASTFNFDGSLNVSATNDITLTAADSTINFNAGAATFTLWGSAIRGGNVNNNSAVMQTININLRLNGTRTLNVGAAGLALGVMPTSTGTGSRTWTKTGAGDLYLRGNSTGTRIDFAITAGRLIFDNSTGQTTSLFGGGAGTGNLTLSSATELRLNNAGNVTFGTATANAGSVIRLNNSGAVTGNLAVNSGANLIGNGTVTGAIQVGGTVAPGLSIGTIGSSGNLTLDATSVANLEIDRGAGQNADLLNIGGALALNGTINISNLGAPLQAGDTFDFFNAASVSGTWTIGAIPSLSVGLAWDFSQLDSQGVASVYLVPEPSVLAIGLCGLGLCLRRRR